MPATHALLREGTHGDVHPSDVLRPTDVAPSLARTGHAPPPSPGGDGGGGRPDGVPVALAVLIVVAIGALLTYLGMLTQIWANISGAQLPGA